MFSEHPGWVSTLEAGHTHSCRAGPPGAAGQASARGARPLGAAGRRLKSGERGFRWSGGWGRDGAAAISASSLSLAMGPGRRSWERVSGYVGFQAALRALHLLPDL